MRIRKIINKIAKGMGGLFLFLVILVVNGVNWTLDTFGPLSFATILYQMNSPLKGTGHEILYHFLIHCLGVTILEFILVMLAWIFLEKCIKVFTFEFQFSAFANEKRLVLDARKWHVIKMVIWIAIVLIGGFGIRKQAIKIGIPEYIERVSVASTIFEEQFVEPDAAAIRFPEEKRNLLFIYLESMEATYASTEEGGGKRQNYIPNLTELAQKEVSFSNTEQLGGCISYGYTGWTMAALLSSTMGAPYLLPVEGNTVGEFQAILPGATSLGDILEAEGYHNYFMCGSDAEFGGRKAYFEQHGNYEIYDYYTAISDGLIDADYFEFWGFEDCKLYQYAKDKLAEISQKDEPFNFTMLTVDTHHMNGYFCELCREEHDEEYGNVISCADRQIQDFLDWAKEQEWYDQTTIVLVGDHTSMNNNFWDEVPTDYRRTTYDCFLNVATSVADIETKNRLFYSMDLFPTTLGAMGVQIEGERLGLGTNLFSDRQTLAEEMGWKQFEEETGKYSKYYDKKLIQGESYE